MTGLPDLLQTADFKTEKHVPVIDLPNGAKADGAFMVNVKVGAEIAHPNTTEHHIDWINVYFLPDGAKFPFLVGRYEFMSHGASPEGANTSTVYSEPDVTFALKTEKPGKLMAISFCNIHGMWTSEKAVEL